MTEQQPEDRYHWIVMFRQNGKIYTYMYRTIPDMTQTVKGHFDKYGVYPYRMWVFVEGEMQKVVIS